MTSVYRNFSKIFSRRIIYLILGTFLSSCATAFLTVRSNPEGALVYVIPKIKWETDSVNLSKPENIPDYIVKAGNTPVYLLELAPMEYVIVAVKDSLQKIKHVDLTNVKGKRNPVEIDLAMK